MVQSIDLVVSRKIDLQCSGVIVIYCSITLTNSRPDQNLLS